MDTIAEGCHMTPSRKHIEVTRKTECIADHHLPRDIELRNIYGIVSVKCREELIRMRDGIFTETYAPVKATDRKNLEHRTGQRRRRPGIYTHKTGTGNEDIW